MFGSVQQAYSTNDTNLDAEWEEIAEVLTTFNETKVKEDIMLFNTWQFKQDGQPGRKYTSADRSTWEEIPGTIRRCTENAEGLWALMLDYDKDVTIADVTADLTGLEYVLYTTFGHTPTNERFRVVLPFSRMMTKQEFDLKKDSILETFRDVDPASFSVSQSFYLHSGPNRNFAYSIWNKGAIISPDNFESREPAVREVQEHNFVAQTDLEVVLQKVKQYYPNPNYTQWITIIFATTNEIGTNAGLNLLSQLWPEREQGEYKRKVNTKGSRSRPLGIGSLIYMIRKYEPNFKMAKKQLSAKEIKEQIMRKYENAD